MELSSFGHKNKKPQASQPMGWDTQDLSKHIRSKTLLNAPRSHSRHELHIFQRCFFNLFQICAPLEVNQHWCSFAVTENLKITISGIAVLAFLEL